MSNQMKIGLGAVIVIVVLATIFYFGTSRNMPPQRVTLYDQSKDEAANPPATNQTPATNTPAVTGNTNADLDQSMTSIDSQLNGLNTDSASVDAGMNDKPVTQAQ